jgi:hypothetical protein
MLPAAITALIHISHSAGRNTPSIPRYLTKSHVQVDATWVMARPAEEASVRRWSVFTVRVRLWASQPAAKAIQFDGFESFKGGAVRLPRWLAGAR